MSLNRKQMLNCCATFAGLFSVRQKPSPTSVLSTIKTEKYQKWNPLFQGRLIKEILKYGTPTYNFLAENDPFFFFLFQSAKQSADVPLLTFIYNSSSEAVNSQKKFRFVLIKKTLSIQCTKQLFSQLLRGSEILKESYLFWGVNRADCN